MLTQGDLSQNREFIGEGLKHRLEKFSIPGASLSIYHEGESLSIAAGFANASTEVEVTPDTLFLSGSIQKVFTASLVMKLAEDSKLDLDRHVSDYLPTFSLKDASGETAITLRQILAHTSGIDGDRFFIDTGPGNDALSNYVDRCNELELLHPPGFLVSYCNAAYAIAGRVIEIATGQDFDGALRDHILTPFELTSTTTFAEEAVLRRVAVGHFPSSKGWRVTGEWAGPRSLGPAGSTMATTASDLVRFGGWHLLTNSITSSSGPSPEAIRQMQQPQSSAFPLEGIRGLGWEILNWNGKSVLSHDGANGGQCAYLRLVPENGIVVALMMNWARGPMAADDILRWIFGDLFEMQIPELPDAESQQIDLKPYVGRYKRLGVRFDVTLEDEVLVCVMEEVGRPKKHEARLRPLAEGRFLFELPVFGDVLVDFLDTDGDGDPDYWHAQGRAARRID